jgi:hypothetical protein
MCDYKYLDQHDDAVEQQDAYHQKVFGEPIDNDPLTMVENSVVSGPPGQPPDSGPTWDPVGPPPIMRDPAVTDRPVLHPRSPDPPDPTVPPRGIPWREPRYQPLGKSVSGKPRTSINLGSGRTAQSSGGTKKTWCPLEEGYVEKTQCLSCKHVSGSVTGCKLKDKLADRLAGKKGGKK